MPCRMQLTFYYDHSRHYLNIHFICINGCRCVLVVCVYWCGVCVCVVYWCGVYVSECRSNTCNSLNGIPLDRINIHRAYMYTVYCLSDCSLPKASLIDSLVDRSFMIFIYSNNSERKITVQSRVVVLIICWSPWSP